MSDKTLEVLKKYRTIAVVGCSRDPSKDAHRIPNYMKENGYKIIPINPYADEILGKRCYPTLLDMPENLQKTVEILDIFRPSEDVPPIVDQAITIRKTVGRPFVIWMQLGIVHERAGERARRAGMDVIMDRCLLVEHRRLVAASQTKM